MKLIFAIFAITTSWASNGVGFSAKVDIQADDGEIKNYHFNYDEDGERVQLIKLKTGTKAECKLALTGQTMNDKKHPVVNAMCSYDKFKSSMGSNCINRGQECSLDVYEDKKTTRIIFKIEN